MATICAWDGVKWVKVWRGGTSISSQLAAEWSDTNLPWVSGDAEEDFPMVTWTPLYTGGAVATDLQARVNYTISQVGGAGPVYITLPEGVHSLVKFNMIGGSGDPLYAFMLWNSRLRGLKAAGDPTNTVIQAEDGQTVSGSWVHAISEAQLTAMAALDPTTYAPLQMGVCRFDSTPTEPFLLGDLTFRAKDQRPITAIHANLAAQGVVVPQPAPHQGIVFHPGTSSARPHAIVNNCRFQGISRAMSSAPPFECGMVNTQYMTAVFRRCEFDCRRAAELDPAQPRRSSPFLMNNDISMNFEDSWFHHSAVNRIAINDENKNTTALSTTYAFVRVKIDHMGDTNNVDPALNGGVSLGGTDHTYLSPIGFESSNALITFTECIIEQNTTSARGGIAITTVGSRNPSGGSLVITDCDFRYAAKPYLKGYARIMIGPTTLWWTAGAPYGTQVWKNGAQLTCISTSTPAVPTEATVSNYNPATHYFAQRF